MLYKNLKTVNIIKIPINIKLKLLKDLYNKLNVKIVGYIKIRDRYNVLLIEISSYIRIWILYSEISIYSK
uniref:Cytochrome b6-f complex subunit PetP n=1 Tax=Taenioma perpusillum TaxID=210852 RepID=A0A1Z1MRZ2_9FLOR|nr:cytochrome b6-f complex subunit PetP [Taenioma perpusillum]ARW68531.1 cytochrome b6-f complex subunit PetP [Taenioma perpusillum]